MNAGQNSGQNVISGGNGTSDDDVANESTGDGDDNCAADVTGGATQSPSASPSMACQESRGLRAADT